MAASGTNIQNRVEFGISFAFDYEAGIIGVPCTILLHCIIKALIDLFFFTKFLFFNDKNFCFGNAVRKNYIKKAQYCCLHFIGTFQDTIHLYIMQYI